MVTEVSRMLGKSICAHLLKMDFFICLHQFFRRCANITSCSFSYFALVKLFNFGILVIRLFNSEERTCILQISGYLLEL
jgi:hypothetical protein